MGSRKSHIALGSGYLLASKFEKLSRSTIEVLLELHMALWQSARAVRKFCQI